jgi:TetR/AcrR family transcriptional repressor of nem operon
LVKNSISSLEKERIMPRPDTGTRQKLIETASDLIWMSSYGGVSVDDICKAAGVKKGSFYHYFPSKQALAVTVMDEHYEQHLKPLLEKLLTANLTTAERMELLANTIINEQKETLAKYGRVCGCPLGALASEMISDDGQDITDKVNETFKLCKGYVRIVLEKAKLEGLISEDEIDSKTDEIHDFTTGMMMMARIHNNLDGLERDLKQGLLRIIDAKQSDTEIYTSLRRN